MKSSELKQLIKEEIVSILNENQDMRGIIDEFSKEFNIPTYSLRYFDYGSGGSGELRIEMKKNILDDFGKMVKFLQDKGFEVDENKSEVDYEIDDDRIRYPYIKIKKSKELTNELDTNDPKSEKEIQQGLLKGLSSLKSDIPSIKPSPKDNQKLNESVAWTVYNVVVGAPGLLNALGGAANWIGKHILRIKDKEGDGTSLGKALKSASHGLESAYLKVIKSVLKKAYPDLYGNVEDKGPLAADNLNDTARKIYIGLLGAGIMGAGVSLTHAHGLISTAVAGAEVGLHSKDIAVLTKDIAGVKPI